MHRGPVVGCGVRKHFPDVAGSESDPDAVTDTDTNPDAHADANPDADADADTNSHTNPDTESGRVQHFHHDHTESGAVDRRRGRGL